MPHDLSVAAVGHRLAVAPPPAPYLCPMPLDTNASFAAEAPTPAGA